MYIDKPDMLKNALMNGVNLFTGAGFSVLPSPSGEYLPTGPELEQDVRDHFRLDPGGLLSLVRLCTLAERTYGQEVQDFLRKRLTVKSLNPAYLNLKRVKIRAYFTTNPDNLIRLIMDADPQQELYSPAESGAIGPDEKADVVMFYPLHGDATDKTRPLLFGKSQISRAGRSNIAMFSEIGRHMLARPTVFWGYGFHDEGVSQEIDPMMEDPNCERIWIMLRPGDQGNADYYRQLGCNIISGDTEEFLDWIGRNCELPPSQDQPESALSDKLKPYLVPPGISKLEAVSMEDYLVGGKTNWYSVLNAQAFKTEVTLNMWDTACGHENVIGLGIPFCGKTTLLMQIACLDSAEVKLMLQRPSQRLAQRVLRELNGRQATIYIDDCATDMLALADLIKAPNTRVIAVADGLDFEPGSHLVAKLDYAVENLAKMNGDEARQIYQRIPASLRTESFQYGGAPYRSTTLQEYSIHDLLLENVPGIPTVDRMAATMKRVLAATSDGFEALILAAFLEKFDSALNVDTLFAYYPRWVTYEEITRTMKQVYELLIQDDICMLGAPTDQDYYFVRSNFFGQLVLDTALSRFREDFQTILRCFYTCVPHFRIYNYNTFCRRAFDSRFFRVVFDGEADEIYESLCNFAPTDKKAAFVLQQWALYKSACGDFKEAFDKIDRAARELPNNFSVRNSQAIIRFQANKSIEGEAAQEERRAVMKLLENCIESDTRKMYHVKRYTQFAIYLARRRNEPTYLPKAVKYLKQWPKWDFQHEREVRKLLGGVEKVQSSLKTCGGAL